MDYLDFSTRWKQSGGAERANYTLFLHELCALIGVDPPQPTTANPAQDAYVLERPVTFTDGPNSRWGALTSISGAALCSKPNRARPIHPRLG